MTTKELEERVRLAESTILNLINTYGAKRLAYGMIMWYGCRSLLDEGDLAGIEKEIKGTKED